jgi:hypothetical protein
MLQEAIRNLAPLGLSAIAILFIYLVFRGSQSYRRLFGLLAVIAIVFLAVLEKFYPAPLFTDTSQAREKMTTSGNPVTIPAPPGGQVSWFDTSISADWGGRDRASSNGSIPKYSLPATDLCNDNRIGYVAVCWDTRPNGYPANVPTDIPGGSSPPNWCTYKGPEIRLATPPDGRAPPGRVFLCARSVSR